MGKGEKTPGSQSWDWKVKIMSGIAEQTPYSQNHSIDKITPEAMCLAVILSSSQTLVPFCELCDRKTMSVIVTTLAQSTTSTVVVVLLLVLLVLLLLLVLKKKFLNGTYSTGLTCAVKYTSLCTTFHIKPETDKVLLTLTV